MSRAISVVLVLVVGGCGHVTSIAEDASVDSDVDSDTDGDTDTDSDTDTDVCSASGNWYDAAMGLCWQNPPSDDEFYWDDAMTYCDSLSLGGYDDWRLPMIQELIWLLRGCVDGVATGDLSTSDCGLSDPDCLGYECWGDACDYCDYLAGPDDDPGGCYWVPELEGTCTWYWSSSFYANEDDISSAWGVSFDSGIGSYGVETITNYARCVRGGP